MRSILSIARSILSDSAACGCTSFFKAFLFLLLSTVLFLIITSIPLYAAIFDGTVSSEQKISDTEGGFTGVLDDNDSFGSSVANMGDLNGDGVDDLAVGANMDDDGGTGRGAVWILFLSNLTAPQSFSVDGGSSGCSLVNSPVTLATSILNILIVLLPALIVGILMVRRAKTNHG